MKIKAENISISFGKKRVLDKISFEIDDGKMLTIVGKSGEGKTLILRAIAGLTEIETGEIYYDDKKYSSMKESDWQEIRRRMGFVFQFGSLIDSLTVKENIALYLRFHTKYAKKKIEDKIVSVLNDLDMEYALNKYPSELSGGMRKRASIASALIKDPDIILFDEPTTGLDPVNKDTVIQGIDYLHKKGKYSILIVTHDMDIPLYFNSPTIYLENGGIQFRGNIKDFMQRDYPYVIKNKEYKNA